MWKTKVFKTKAAWSAWVEKNGNEYQWQEIYVNNAYGVQYKPLLLIY